MKDECSMEFLRGIVGGGATAGAVGKIALQKLARPLSSRVASARSTVVPTGRVAVASDATPKAGGCVGGVCPV